MVENLGDFCGLDYEASGRSGAALSNPQLLMCFLQLYVVHKYSLRKAHEVTSQILREMLSPEVF